MVDFERNADEIFAFFKMNTGDEQRIHRRKLNFVAQSGYTLANVVKTDFLACTSALLFSKRFFNRVGKHFKEEMQFFPCQVSCQGVNLEWYAVKILRLISIINIDKEGDCEYINDDIIFDPIKYRGDIAERFYIARDCNEVTEFVVTELFVDVCNANNILIDYEEVPYSC